ncbi:MAG: alpha/beta hydrolase [Synechococcales bacterium]|nr:alpha/beta hydrolase [Synechococcales bacterium]
MQQSPLSARPVKTTMFASFLPQETQQLTEATSIALAQAITRTEIQTPLSPAPIATAYTRSPDLSQSTPSLSVATSQPQPPILLLHGFDSSLLEFRRLMPQLAPHRETWAMDLLGFGFSNRAADLPFTPEAIKTHLYAFWKTCIGRPMTLVGASMGGAAAIDFCLTYPETVAQLVLLDAAGFAKGPAISRFLFPPLGYWATEFLRQPKVRAQVSRKAYRDQRFVTADAELCAALHLKLPRWSEALIDFTRSGGYNFLSDRIAHITQPTLIVWGRQDGILGTRDAERFQAAIAGSQLIWIEDCGHVPHLEQPQTTANTILQF